MRSQTLWRRTAKAGVANHAKEMDLARSIQVITEEVMLKMTKYAHRETGMKKLCMAGGVALNCVANGRVLREVPFEDIWIQPAAGDAGGARWVSHLRSGTATWNSQGTARKAGAWQSTSTSTSTVASLTKTAEAMEGEVQITGLAAYADGMKGSYLGPRHTEKRSKVPAIEGACLTKISARGRLPARC
jgi:carbamoyltransferase